MMPDPANVHYDVPLTNVSLAYRNLSYVGPLIAPEVIVRKQSDRYFIYDPERESFRSSNDARSPGVAANEVDFALSTESYFCDDHALASLIPDEEGDNADQPLRPEVDRVEFLTDKILLNQEMDLAAKLTTPGAVSGSDLTALNQSWDDGEGDPLAAIAMGRQSILNQVQTLANTLVLSDAVYTSLRSHPKVVGSFAGQPPTIVDAAALARIFEVDRVLVARAVKNTAPVGQPAVMVPVWGKDALLLAVNPRPGLKAMTPVITFVWGAPNSSRGTSVQTWREERRKATAVRVQKYYDHRVVASQAAYLLKNVLS